MLSYNERLHQKRVEQSNLSKERKKLLIEILNCKDCKIRRCTLHLEKYTRLK